MSSGIEKFCDCVIDDDFGNAKKHLHNAVADKFNSQINTIVANIRNKMRDNKENDNLEG